MALFSNHDQIIKPRHICNSVPNRSTVDTRAVEPQPKQFWIARVGAKKIQMVEPEPEIWVPIQQI